MATETQRHRDKKYRDRESPKSVFFLLCSKVFCLFMLKSTIRVHPVSKNWSPVKKKHYYIVAKTKACSWCGIEPSGIFYRKRVRCHYRIIFAYPKAGCYTVIYRNMKWYVECLSSIISQPCMRNFQNAKRFAIGEGVDWKTELAFIERLDF